ncbi:MAG: TrkH family potassium uptake protein [Woeseiaceae bacterium]
MQTGVVIRTLGVLLLLFSTTLIPPLAVSLIYGDGEFDHLSLTFGAALLAGASLWLSLRGTLARIRHRDGFVIVALMWIAMSVLGALPFVLGLHVPFVDALFEATSGYTTTGSTVLVGLDNLPPSILFYRQEINWLGGIGVIVLAVALLPMLGIGGMQLYRAETPGPVKDERITPRIAGTARTLCVLYLWMTIACAFCFWLAGMTVFDAIGHSFATLATGGFSTHDASFSYFDSPAIEAVGVFFMLAAGISFNVHFVVWRTLRISTYFRNTQTKAFLAVVGALIACIALVLYETGTKSSAEDAIRAAAFEVASVVTNTGFGVDDFSLWPYALPALLIFGSIMGGCAGSTAGGMKVIRLVIVGKQGIAQIRQLIHPRAVLPIRVDGQVVPEAVIDGVWGFFAMYVFVYVGTMILLMMDGMDQVTAFGAVAACLNNLGPGLGDVAVNFAGVSPEGKLLLVFTMLFGRMEIFTFLVLLAPSFWKD